MRKVVCFFIVLTIISFVSMNAKALEQDNNYNINEKNQISVPSEETKDNQEKNRETSEEVQNNEKKEQFDNDYNKTEQIDEENTVIDQVDKSIIEPQLTYSTHVQSIGWTDYVSSGNISGTEGQAKRMEAIKIKLSLGSYQGDIEYSTHIQSFGWTNSVNNNQISGTVGQAKRLEAIKIKLTGDIANSYDIYYRVHIQSVGWLDWTCNGQAAGSQTYGYRLEAIEIRLIKKGDSVPTNIDKPFLIPGNIFYSTHIQSDGWSNNVGDGKVSGTTCQAKRMEAIKINLNDAVYDGEVEYSTHVQSIGWTKYVSNGKISGTEGQAKRIEAIKIRLTGDIADQYDVYYRVYIQKAGWLDWAKNDQTAGSEGFAYRMEAIEIILIKKGGVAPGNTSKPCLTFGNINYQAHIQSNGWINAVSNGVTCGAIGQSKRLEAIRITLGDNQISGNVEYSSHVQSLGWTEYVSNGDLSGTEGQAKRIEALKIRLSGEVANYYDIYYRAYTQQFGWLGWTCNDRVAGTTNGSFRLEAIQIKLYPKNTGPGVDKKSVINFVNDGNYKVCQDAFGNIYTDAEPLLGKRGGYTIFTNLSTNIVNVFIADGTGKEIITFKRYQCTSGAPSTPTIRGTYYIYMKRYYFDSGAARCFYFSPFKGGYGFHTVLCYKDPTPSRIMDGRLGMYLSHGCIRLAIENAKWIYDNCSIGTKVINL